ncbi:MAG: cytochrome c, partial [Verrucomicrobiota bacterium]
MLRATAWLLIGLGAFPVLARPAEVTFAEHIAPIIHEKCTRCHRPGQAGPFSLITYRDVLRRADTIRAVVNAGYMPPWPPKEGYGEFRHERRLSKEQIRLINQWVERDAPMGDPERMPEPPEFPEGWMLGKPDLVVRMNGTFVIPPDGPDVYRTFIFPLNLPEDRWVRGVALRPKAISALHHANFLLDGTGIARRYDGRDGQPGISW